MRSGEKQQKGQLVIIRRHRTDAQRTGAFLCISQLKKRRCVFKQKCATVLSLLFVCERTVESAFSSAMRRLSITNSKMRSYESQPLQLWKCASIQKIEFVNHPSWLSRMNDSVASFSHWNRRSDISYRGTTFFTTGAQP